MSPSVRECRHRYENVAIGTGMSPPQPEIQSEQELENPKTLQTYTDFKKTLSEGERENFFNFVKEKTNNLEKPINDLEAWLASKNAAKQNRWEIYYKNYQEEKISQSARNNKQNPGSGKLSPEQVQRAIAEFKKQRKINQPVDEPENIDSEEHRQREAEFNKLLDNPPEREVRKSPAQQRREAIAEARRQQEAIRRANREAAESRAKQQNPDLEQRKLETLRQIEEMNQRQPSQNPEIDEEDW
ncbi:MAG: hypothetical protein WBM44_06240 [Waterburya sp.]